MISTTKTNCNRPPSSPLHRFAHDAMACTFEVWLIEPDAKYAEQAALAAFAELDRLEQELSRFVPTSDVARINALLPGQTARVGIEAVDCLQLAAQVQQQTAGAFVVARVGSSTRSPSSGPALELNADQRLVTKPAAAATIDLGGIGKGYAVDQMTAVLRAWRITAALIHSGQSTAYALRNPPAAKGWPLALRDPLDHQKTIGSLQLRNDAVSGSGNKLHGGHIIDPRTGRPPTHTLGAWASAPTAALSDALATAFMVMSPDAVRAFCADNPQVSALIILRDASTRQKGESIAGEPPKILCLGPWTAEATGETTCARLKDTPPCLDCWRSRTGC